MQEDTMERAVQEKFTQADELLAEAQKLLRDAGEEARALDCGEARICVADAAGWDAD